MPSPPPRPSLLGVAAALYAALFAAALFWAHWADRPLWFANAEAAARGVAPLRDVAAGAALGLATVLLSGWLARATRAGEALARALARLIGRRTLGECVALALLSGIAEEAFFRGAMQPGIGLVPTSFVFALVHFVPRRELLPWSAFALVAGLALGGLFEATGNLIAPVVAHVTVNAVNLRLLSRDYAER